MTLCFVLCRFDFDVLTFYFCILCIMSHILNGAIHEVKRREYKYCNASVVMLVFIYLKSCSW